MLGAVLCLSWTQRPVPKLSPRQGLGSKSLSSETGMIGAPVVLNRSPLSPYEINVSKAFTELGLTNPRLYDQGMMDVHRLGAGRRATFRSTTWSPLSRTVSALTGLPLREHLPSRILTTRTWRVETLSRTELRYGSSCPRETQYGTNCWALERCKLTDCLAVP
jgi:hypothetical protein